MSDFDEKTVICQLEKILIFILYVEFNFKPWLKN